MSKERPGGEHCINCSVAFFKLTGSLKARRDTLKIAQLIYWSITRVLDLSTKFLLTNGSTDLQLSKYGTDYEVKDPGKSIRSQELLNN